MAPLGLLILAMVASCGGSDEDEPKNNDPTSNGASSGANIPGGGGSNSSGANVDPTNRAPVAAFSISASSVQAGGALAFDASASSDPDGDPLEHSWSFGDGSRGGVEKIAHLFTQPGSHEVTLTVSDGRGGSDTTSQLLTVTPGPTPTGAVTMAVRVLNTSRSPLIGASVRVGAGATVIVNEEGIATLSLQAGVPQVLHAERAGFTRQLRTITLKGSADGEMEMILREAPPTLSLADAAAGGEVSGEAGAKVRLPAAALVDSSGAPVSGAVEVQVVPVDVVAQPGLFPGTYAGLLPSAERTGIVSYGTVDFVFTQNGQKLDLAPGQRATVELPVFPRRHADGSLIATGDSVPLWSLDESSGVWVQEGDAPIVASASSPTGFVQRAEVRHFSWWNCDYPVPLHPIPVSCCMDDDDDDLCDGAAVSCFIQAATCATPECTHELAQSNAPEPIPQFGNPTAVLGEELASLDLPRLPLLMTASRGSSRVQKVVPADLPSSLVFQLKPYTPVPSDKLVSLPFEITTTALDDNEKTTYEFDANAGDEIWVQVQSVGAAVLSWQADWRGPDGSSLSTWQNPSNRDGVLRTVAAGRHKVEISAANPFGSYRLRIRRFTESTLRVVAMTPAANSNGPPPAVLSVQFSRPMRSSSVNSSSLRIVDQLGQTVPLTGLTFDGQTVLVGPPPAPSTSHFNNFGAGLSYAVEISALVTDVSNQTLGAAYNAEFRTADAPGFWSKFGTANSRALAMSEDGTSFAIATIDNRVRASRYVPGEGWGNWATISTAVPTTAVVIASAGGRAVVVWGQGAPVRPYASVFVPATGWSDPVAIPVDASRGFRNFGFPAPAMDATGRAIFLWQPESGNGAFYSRYTPAGGWGTVTSLQPAVAVSTFSKLELNAAGKGGWAHGSAESTLLHYDLATDTFGPPRALGAGGVKSNGEALRVDADGDLYVLRFAAGSRPMVTRSRAAEAATSFTFTDAYTTNCDPTLAVTPTGKMALVNCVSADGSLRVSWNDGGPIDQWTHSVLGAAEPVWNVRSIASGEDVFLIGSATNQSLRHWHRPAAANSWGAAVLAGNAATVNQSLDSIVGSASRVLFGHNYGAIWRVK